MEILKNKLIDIAKEIIINNADCSEISDDIITLDECSFDHACEKIADSIIEKLPELLSDSECVKLPAKIGETIYFTCGDEIKQLLIRKIRLNGSNYITYFGYDPNDKNRKEINVYECYRITEAEAEKRLKALEKE